MAEFEDAPGYKKLTHSIVADNRQELESYKIKKNYQMQTTSTITSLQNDINILKEEMKILKSHLNL